MLSSCFWIYFINRDSSKAVFTIFAGAMLCISIWIVRNYLVFNSVIFVSTNGGVNLLLGNSENTMPNSGTNVDISKYRMIAKEKRLSEVERDKFYRNEAIRYILSNKWHSVKLYILKFINYFNYRNELATRKISLPKKDLIMLLTYIPLLLMFILRLILIRLISITKIELFLIFLYIANGLFSAIFFTRIRFRLPFDFLIIGIGSIFITQLIHQFILVKYKDKAGLTPCPTRN
jgi:hypothetical protein